MRWFSSVFLRFDNRHKRNICLVADSNSFGKVVIGSVLYGLGTHTSSIKSICFIGKPLVGCCWSTDIFIYLKRLPWMCPLWARNPHFFHKELIGSRKPEQGLFEI